MYRTNGLYVPTHRPRPAPAIKRDTDLAAENRPVPGATEPFMFTRLMLVTAAILGVLAVAGVFSS